jgi:multisubunit Na+/H+ antiporter MnhG subunit
MRIPTMKKIALLFFVLVANPAAPAAIASATTVRMRASSSSVAARS